MPLTTIKDKKIDEAIQDLLEESGCSKYVREIISRFSECPLYFWGGIPRGALIRVNNKETKGTETKDTDILLDDSKGPIDLWERMQGLDNVVPTRINTPKWKPEDGIEIDISTFGNSRKANQDFYELNFENALNHCDFTSSAAAYSPDEKALYSYGAIEAVKAREVDLNFPGDKLHVLIARAVLHSDKLNFKIGQKALEFITKNYSEKEDEHIKRYLDYKEIPEKYDIVIGKVKEISGKKSTKTLIIPAYAYDLQTTSTSSVRS